MGTDARERRSSPSDMTDEEGTSWSRCFRQPRPAGARKKGSDETLSLP